MTTRSMSPDIDEMDLGVFIIDPAPRKVEGLKHCDACPDHCCARGCPHFSGEI